MERTAEAQLTRDNANIEQDDQYFGTFQKADDAVLASRMIHSLPCLGGNSTSGSRSPAASGFGLKQTMPSLTTESPASTIVPATTGAPFTFDKFPSAAPAPNFSFKPSSSTPAPLTTPSLSSQPLTSPMSSNLIFGHNPRASFSRPSTSSPLKKGITACPSGAPPSTFASPLPSSVPTSDVKPNPTFSFPTSRSRGQTTSYLSEIRGSQADVDYWKDLHELNISFFATARSLYDEDVFSDMGQLLAGYCNIRHELKEKRKAASAPPPAVKSTASGRVFSFAGKSIPVGPLAPPTSNTMPTTGIGAFPATGFSFGGKAVSFTSDSGSSAVIVAAGSSERTSTDVKGGDSRQTNLSQLEGPTKETKDSGSAFSFGALPGVKPIPSFGGFGAPSGGSDFKGFGVGTTQNSTTTGATKQTFSFGLPVPGTTKPLEKTEESSASTAPKPAFSFGLLPGSTTASTRDSKLGLGFANTPTSSLLSREQKPPSVGGFNLGNLPSWPPAKDPSDSNISSGGPKSVSIGGSSLRIGAVPPTPAGGTPGTETPAAQPDNGTSGGEDHVPSTEQRYDVEGPGEEDEETVGGTSWRARIWQLGKARGEDGKEKEGAGVEWVDFGTNFVRLKKHKTTGSKRILARHSKTGHIVMNFAFFPQLSPKVTDKSISFVGVANGKPASFRMKLYTAEQAAQLLKTWKELIDTAPQSHEDRASEASQSIVTSPPSLD